MNWEQIAKKYPRAFKLLCDKLGFVAYYSELFEEEMTLLKQFKENLFSHEDYGWNIRELYDFFDEHEIMICITYEFDWGYEIYESGSDMICSVKKWYNTRKEAETEAFTKAFKYIKTK